jgi:hypothetical protein
LLIIRAPIRAPLSQALHGRVVVDYALIEY